MTSPEKPYFTPQVVSNLPVDKNHPLYARFAAEIQRFPQESVYIYSFDENKLLYAAGWQETLGYADDEIDLVTIVKQTDPYYAPFAYDLNDCAVQFILSRKERLLEYAVSMEVKKIHRNGHLVPMRVKLAIYSVHEDGRLQSAIGRFQIDHSIRFGKVLRYAAFGPNKDDFEEALNQSLFKHITLSDKEKEAMVLVAQGMAFKEIADQLNITVSAVEKRILPLYKRFDVKSLPHLISFAYENFILP
ncbi:MAG: helix-turn-helix transcriptional regulator [Sphingobacteriia bacterium]|nr:MAG: helix-turn-helix transcriptional regulator [Sphingobacteriia bacterium]